MTMKIASDRNETTRNRDRQLNYILNISLILSVNGPSPVLGDHNKIRL